MRTVMFQHIRNDNDHPSVRTVQMWGGSDVGRTFVSRTINAERLGNPRPTVDLGGSEILALQWVMAARKSSPYKS